METEEIREWLKPVLDPELHLSIVELGLIYECLFDEITGKVNLKLTLTSPMCPAGDYIMDELRKRLSEHEKVKETIIELVWEPKWDPAVMASEECKEAMGLW